MATITKKELIDRIAEGSGQKRVQVKKVVQQFLDEIVNELGKGNRLEFRDFGVFETKLRKARRAQNPQTLEPAAGPGQPRFRAGGIRNELGRGTRLEFRDFGVFETKLRKARRAQNPKTLEPVAVPEKRTVKFKVGRVMTQGLGERTGAGQ